MENLTIIYACTLIGMIVAIIFVWCKDNEAFIKLYYGSPAFKRHFEGLYASEDANNLWQRMCVRIPRWLIWSTFAILFIPVAVVMFVPPPLYELIEANVLWLIVYTVIFSAFYLAYAYGCKKTRDEWREKPDDNV